MRVPIQLRSHEEAQLESFVPRMVDRLNDMGVEAEAEDIENVELIDEGDGTFSAEVSEWTALLGGMRVLRDEEGLRSWWLRKKLSRRLMRIQEKLE